MPARKRRDELASVARRAFDDNQTLRRATPLVPNSCSVRFAPLNRVFETGATGLSLCGSARAPCDKEVASLHVRVKTGLEQAGRPMPETDGQIAHTAETHGLTLVTRTTADFKN